MFSQRSGSRCARWLILIIPLLASACHSSDDNADTSGSAGSPVTMRPPGATTGPGMTTGSAGGGTISAPGASGTAGGERATAGSAANDPNALPAVNKGEIELVGNVTKASGNTITLEALQFTLPGKAAAYFPVARPKIVVVDSHTLIHNIGSSTPLEASSLGDITSPIVVVGADQGVGKPLPAREIAVPPSTPPVTSVPPSGGSAPMGGGPPAAAPTTGSSLPPQGATGSSGAPAPGSNAAS